MRTKNSILNFISVVIPTLVIAILGLVKIRYFLNYLGSDSVGVYQLFAQIFSYVALLEAGIGASVVFKLYEPIKNNDYNKINSILSAARMYFRKIAILMIIIGSIISFLIPVIIHENSLSYGYIQISMILYVISVAITYFVSAPTLYNTANQKNYKNDLTYNILYIVKNIFEIILVCLGLNILGLMILFVCFSLVYNFIIIYLHKKNNKKIKFIAEKDYEFKKNSKTLFVNRLGDLIYNNIDMLLISSFLGLSSVVTYSAYYYILNTFSLMINKISHATVSSFGNLIVSEKNKVYSVFKEYYNIIMYLATILTIPLLFFITPFINLWYGGEFTLNAPTTFLMVLMIFMSITTIPLYTLMNSSGSFVKIKNCTIVQSVSNLVLSIVLIQFYGIIGVIIATIISLLIGPFILYPKYLYQNYFFVSPLDFYKKFAKLISIYFINILIILCIYDYILIENLFDWFVFGLLFFLINLILTTIFYYLLKELDFVNRFIYIYKEKKNKH